MIDKIILDIRHSDDYTDYIFATACMTNMRVVPIIGAKDEEIKKQSDLRTRVLRCFGLKRELREGDRVADADSGVIRVLTRYYILDDGTINYTNAERVRATVQECILRVLNEPENIRELFRLNFPLLWSKRQMIYDSPQMFHTGCGRYTTSLSEAPLGAVLKAMEESGDFRLKLGGGCNCPSGPLLIDYGTYNPGNYSGTWILHTWCPTCHSRREIKAMDFQRAAALDLDIEVQRRKYDKGQGLSSLSLFDVVDELKKTAER